MRRITQALLLLLTLFCITACGYDPDAVLNDTPTESAVSELTDSYETVLKEILPTITELPYTVNLYLECQNNALFNKYDLSVLLDGEEIGILEHGTEQTVQVRVSEGAHTLQFKSTADDTASEAVEFTVLEEESDFNYRLKCQRDGVEVEYLAPETSAPETLAPETLAPETVAPETLAPETVAPETLAPETVAPETKPSGGASGGGGITVPDQEETEGQLVWVPVNGGTKYHIKSTCSSMIDPMQVTVETAEANGYTPCKRCYG